MRGAKSQAQVVARGIEEALVRKTGRIRRRGLIDCCADGVLC